MLLQGMEGSWVVIEASHTVRSGLNVTCHMLTIVLEILIIRYRAKLTTLGYFE